MVEVEDRWKKRIKAPLGVYAWTALVLIKFGILNSIGFFLSFRQVNGDVSLPVVVVSFSLSIFTAGAAVWATIGDNAGRIALLILTPLNIVWVVLLVLQPLFGNDKDLAVGAFNVILGQVFLTLWVIGMEWYFLTKKVVEYYKQDD